MLTNKEQFEEFLLESFQDGRSVRELRLSDEEANYIKIKIPRAKFTELEDSDLRSVKRWYKVDTKRG